MPHQSFMEHINAHEQFVETPFQLYSTGITDWVFRKNKVGSRVVGNYGKTFLLLVNPITKAVCLDHELWQTWNENRFRWLLGGLARCTVDRPSLFARKCYVSECHWGCQKNWKRHPEPGWPKSRKSFPFGSPKKVHSRTKGLTSSVKINQTAASGSDQ